MEVYTTISAGNYGRTIEIALPASMPTNDQILGVSFIQNNSLYYIATADNVYPSLSVKPNGRIQLMGLNKDLIFQEERIIALLVAYMIA